MTSTGYDLFADGSRYGGCVNREEWAGAASDVGAQPKNAEDLRVWKFLGLTGKFNQQVDAAAQESVRDRATGLRAIYGGDITPSRCWKVALAEQIDGFVAGDAVMLNDATSEGEWLVVSARYNKRYSFPGMVSLRRPGSDDRVAMTIAAERLSLVRRLPESKWARGY